MKFRTKRRSIDAWRWLFTDRQDRAPSWVSDALFKWPDVGSIAFEPQHAEGARICVATPLGISIAKPGDWICRSEDGEVFSCEQAVFDATYELVPTLAEAKL